MALITSLLLLIVVTILALSMFKSFGLQERISGNVREKERALHAAEHAQQYAEWWLAQGNSSMLPVVCDSVLNANQNEGQICASPAPTRDDLRGSAGWSAGVTYNPGGTDMLLTADHPNTAGTFFAVPQFRITDVGASKSGNGEIFQVDALGYGANSNAVAVVESTVEISSGVIDRGGL